MEPTRRVGRDPDWTDLEAEGLPVLEEQPPGIDAETAEEGMFPPRDHPVAVDEVGVTAAEEAVPEAVGERSARERPEGRQFPADEAVGGLAETDDEPTGELTAELEDEPPSGAAEEAAMHLEDPGG